MKQIAIVVASHGELARYAMKSAEMIVGEQTNYGVLSVMMDMTLKMHREQMNEILNDLDTENGVVILVDLFGGTPSNVAGTIYLEREDVLIVSGLNLPMLIDLCLNRHESLDDLAKRLEETYKQGFVNISQRLKESEESDDECRIL